MKTNTFIAAMALFLIAIANLNLASALVIHAGNNLGIAPGSGGDITLNIDNNFDYDIADVAFALSFTDGKFSPIGGSSQTLDTIEEGDDKTLLFRIAVAEDTKTGDYILPYTLTYKIANCSSSLIPNPCYRQEIGSIGVKVSGAPVLEYIASSDTQIIGKGKLNLKIINKGYADAKFVSVKLNSGVTIVSEPVSYIGTINSDDFDSVSFDVVFNKENPIVSFTVDYTDNGVKKSQDLNLPVIIYSSDEAARLGLVKKTPVLLYLLFLVAVVLGYLLYRRLKKRKKAKSLEN
jgi:uncharacterized membrane protein